MLKFQREFIAKNMYRHLHRIQKRIDFLKINDEILNKRLENAHNFAKATSMLIVGFENKRLVAAAKQPRKSNHEETRAKLITFRDAYIERHGKERGWKTAAINDIGIDVSNHKAIDKLIGTD